MTDYTLSRARDEINSLDVRISSHEKECAVRYAGISDQLSGIKKAIWWAVTSALGILVMLVGNALNLY